MNIGNRELEKQSENNKMVITTYFSTISLNVKGLNDPIKRHKEAEWIKK